MNTDVPLEGKGIPLKNDGVNPGINKTCNFAPAATDRRGITGITPRKTKDNAEFVARRITPRKNEYHDAFVTGITPRKTAAYINSVS